MSAECRALGDPHKGGLLATAFTLFLLALLHFPVSASAESPGVTTEAAGEVTSKTAILHGGVNPHGFETKYHFEYGTTTSYGTSVPVPDKGIGSGSVLLKVSEPISALAANTTYHFRIAATSPEGISFGKDQTFTTEVDPRFSLSSGEYGEEDGKFVFPYGIAIDSKDNIWVADRVNARIEKFDSKGEYLNKFGTLGEEDGQLANPYGIEIDSQGNIWVVDTENFRIQKFNPEGEYLGKFGTIGSGDGKFLLIYDLAIDSKGNIFVADTESHRIQKFNSEGKYLSKFGSEGSGNGQLRYPLGIAVDAEDNVLVADANNNRIQMFNSKGEYLSKFGSKGVGDGQFLSPAGIAIDAGGKIWVTDADPDGSRVQGFSPKGEYLSKFGSWGEGSGLLYGPADIEVDSTGSIWVADFNNSRIQKWTPIRPMTTTEAASEVTSKAATLNATVNPKGFETTYRFEYGTTTSYGTSVPVPDKGIGSGASGVKVGEGISGLAASTTYHFRVVATNSEGTSFGKDETFTTK